MVRCDRSDHDHATLEMARMCAALADIEVDPRVLRAGSQFPAILWVLDRVRDRVAEIDAAARARVA